MAGKVLTRSDIDERVGNALLRLNQAMLEVNGIRDGLQVFSDDALVALGYEPAEVAQMRSALNDGNQLYNIYRGAQSGTLPNPKDFRDHMKHLWGLGL